MGAAASCNESLSMTLSWLAHLLKLGKSIVRLSLCRGIRVEAGLEMVSL